MPSTRPSIIFVVWSPVTGPIAAYHNFGLANRHAETMVGVEVRSLDLLSALPRLVLDDVVTTDYCTDDPTPVDSPPVRASTPVVLSVDALEDAETRVVDVDDE